MTTKNTSAGAEPQRTAGSKAARVAPANPHGRVESIVLSHHLNIEGTDHPPGSKIWVSADYARRLRRQGYIART
ncbi:hypothetical protein [Streptomyces boncukensis]|uniref:Uncharacterized protein n=1 Tax=Streptomyces boncukensis TaxID=2711219 RepID=A0A6G4WSB6_9ACTN|nr:hypothetical protein [Streptomyces boncukensis]NGO67893.1 hypothetical protein [Streptomyces boncukensis]